MAAEMLDSPRHVAALINTVYRFLELIDDNPLKSLLADWPAVDICRMRSFVPRVLPVLAWMPEAVTAADKRGVLIVDKLAALANQISWGQTYTAEDFGPEFLEKYGWTELIGERGPLASDRIACGFLMLGPHIEYPQHSHAAEEVYVPLTGQTLWRQGRQNWIPRPPCRPIYHPPRFPHAMRTENLPLLALYLWRGATLTEKSRIEISDHQQSWGYEDGPSKGPGPRSAGGR